MREGTITLTQQGSNNTLAIKVQQNDHPTVYIDWDDHSFSASDVKFQFSINGIVYETTESTHGWNIKLPANSSEITIEYISVQLTNTGVEQFCFELQLTADGSMVDVAPDEYIDPDTRVTIHASNQTIQDPNGKHLTFTLIQSYVL